MQFSMVKYFAFNSNLFSTILDVFQSKNKNLNFLLADTVWQC